MSEPFGIRLTLPWLARLGRCTTDILSDAATTDAPVRACVRSPSRSRRLRDLRCWVPAWLLVLPCSALVAGPTIEEYPVPGHGELQLQVPAEWQVQYLYTEDASVRPTLYVFPLEGQAFQMTVTVYWHDGMDMDITSAESLRKRVEQAGNLAMQDSTETAVSIRQFDGIRQPGFYYDLHDGSATAEEFHYLTQGAYAVGQLVLAFTILTDERPSAHREACLNFLRLIRQLGAARDVRGARVVGPLSRWL